MYRSISISGILTLDLHALNNEGTEGNTMMTRMVDIVDKEGKRATVNAISGDMFKHIQAEHLFHEAETMQLPLCAGCRLFDANRIGADNEFKEGFRAGATNEEILEKLVNRCVLDDCEGILLTGNIGGNPRSLARKSCVEFGWVVGLPESTTTDSYFHAKYVPERGKGSGQEENLGQNIFHRPASSGQYAAVVCVDLYRVGRNDISLKYVLNEDERKKRIGALLRSILHTFIRPTGAQRNTQNPHVVDFRGVITASRSAMPAPCISGLNSDFENEIEQLCQTLNKLSEASSEQQKPIDLFAFKSLSEFGKSMETLIQSLSNGGV
ncbi:MAG TPA: DevR family CRISPR-associated autoregulator [Chthonomonas sp.]|uniref:DevR family CRISPR-associated autoregulator n=1 Tax=Chthonomonas sp. TaxID=2282153 RepID=UPI002B4B1A32|nr:DevR family CRISPR-associated autoregulator [Chthonomonas sp.]HLI47384.1 DevR family CRISPR-associated autoregulator [Chthonomonas sp.]